MVNYEEELKKALKKSKIRKTMKDSVDVKIPRLLIHSLQWISVGYSSALYFAGKKVGLEVVSEEMKGKDMKSVLKEIGNFLKKHNIGKFKIKTIEEKTATVQILDSMTSYGMEKIGKPVCFFEAGLIAGILEAKLKKKITVTEVLCGGLGDSLDEFLIKFT